MDYEIIKTSQEGKNVRKKIIAFKCNPKFEDDILFSARVKFDI